MTSHRDAITGQYVTAEHAKSNPDTTVSESPCAECERLRGIIHTLGWIADDLDRTAAMIQQHAREPREAS